MGFGYRARSESDGVTSGTAETMLEMTLNQQGTPSTQRLRAMPWEKLFIPIQGTPGGGREISCYILNTF